MIEETTASEIATIILRNLLTERFLDGALSVTIFEVGSGAGFMNLAIIDSTLMAIIKETIITLYNLLIERLLDSTLIIITFRFKRALPHF